MVIVDFNGRIRDVKIKHFPEVTLAGFPRGRAKDLRLKTLSELIDYASYHNAKYFVFERIGKIPKRKMETRSVSRKVSKFAYAELLRHGREEERNLHTGKPSICIYRCDSIKREARAGRSYSIGISVGT